MRSQTRYKLKCLSYRIQQRIIFKGHTINCWRNQYHFRKSIDQFKRDHPDYCHACNGWGGGIDHGGYWTPPDSWECSQCVENEICPHCGEDLNMEHPEHDIQCEHCGWNFDNTDGIPDGDDCGCWQLTEEDPY